MNLKPDLFLGGVEDFTDTPSFQNSNKEYSSPSRHSLKEDLEYYFDRKLPGSFNENSPSLWAISDYPLRIVAQEWSRYEAVLYRCIKYFEYSNNETTDFLLGLEKLETDLRLLQGWRRRILSSQQKIDNVTRFIRAQGNYLLGDREMEETLEDYSHLGKTMETYGQRLENMLPIVTSLVQVVDSRRSFAETENISRLTVLALVFVPLTFVSSLFSMSGEIAPGSRRFWVYFAVAIPLTLVVSILARLSNVGVGRFPKLTLFGLTRGNSPLMFQTSLTRQRATPAELDV